MVDHSAMKLGKKAVRHDHRTLRLSKYTTALPAPPPEANWNSALSGLTAMGNDRLGDCTCAAAAHMVQVWTSETSAQVILDDAAVIDFYARACGYDPADPATDQGGVEIDVLNFWKKNGLAGHSIDAFAAVDPKGDTDVKQAVWLFGGAYVGLALPLTAQSQELWDPVSGAGSDADPGSWGGHAVNVCSYNSVGPIFVTWGQLKQMTWAFWNDYCDEAYAVLSPEWAGARPAPSGFDRAALEADLVAVSQTPRG